MGSSLKLFEPFGIPLKIHITFPLILLWAMLQFGLATGLGWTGAIFGFIVTLLLFGIVILHELGHSLAARYYGFPVDEIVMLPIGGVARIREIPEDSTKEFVIAIAGPLVNFAIAAILLLLNTVGLVPIRFENPGVLLAGLENITLATTLGYLWYVNLFIAVFNLIPAFPMDGGRILRAVLGYFMHYARATQIAAGIGQAFAWLLGLFGFFSGNLFLIIIAFFVYMGANQENAQSQQRRLLGDVTVGSAYSQDVWTLTPDDTLQMAINHTLSSFQQDYPVVVDGRLVGLVPYKQLLAAASNYGPDTPIEQVMQESFATTTPGEPLFDVQRRMAEAQNEVLPVVEEGRLLGLLTARDLREVLQLASVQQRVVQPPQSPSDTSGTMTQPA